MVPDSRFRRNDRIGPLVHHFVDFVPPGRVCQLYQQAGQATSGLGQRLGRRYWGPVWQATYSGGRGHSYRFSLGTQIGTPLTVVASSTAITNTKRLNNGGEGGIRTREKLAPLRDFQSRPFVHSGTSPRGDDKLNYRIVPTQPQPSARRGQERRISRTRQSRRKIVRPTRDRDKTGEPAEATTRGCP